MATQSNDYRAPGRNPAAPLGHGAFPVLFLIGRPAAGKSEIIRYLKSVTVEERRDRLHVGDFHELDDFPMIWAWFEEDAILAAHGRSRLHTDAEGYFLDNFLWNVLIERLELEYRKWALELSSEATKALSTDPAALPPAPQDRTAVIEFARGSEHGGLGTAFSFFSEAILRRAAVLYVQVSYAESLRKNRRRFNPDKPHSILEHSLPDEKLERMYRDTDWSELSASDPAYLTCRGVRVPYAVMENEDDVTTKGGEPLGRRLEETLVVLWQRYSTRDRS